VFAEYSSFNNNSQDINIDFQKELSQQDRFSVENTFEHAEDSTSFEDDFGRTSGRYSYYRNIFDTEYTRDLSKHISVQGRYGNESYSASRDDVKSSLLNRVGFDVDYIQSSATTFLAGYDFTARHIDGGGNAAVHTWAAGGRHFLTKQLYVDSRVGVSFVESFNGGSTSEPSVMLALVNDFTETDSAGLSYRQTSVPSAFAADIFDSWRVAVDLNRQLLERLKMAGSLFWGEGDFTAQGITDRQVGVSSRLSYDVSRNTRTFLAYTYSEIDSNIDTRRYARNWLEAGVGVAF
jgi:hypothetical protein